MHPAGMLISGPSPTFLHLGTHQCSAVPPPSQANGPEVQSAAVAGYQHNTAQQGASLSPQNPTGPPGNAGPGHVANCPVPMPCNGLDADCECMCQPPRAMERPRISACDQLLTVITLEHSGRLIQSRNGSCSHCKPSNAAILTQIYNTYRNGKRARPGAVGPVNFPLSYGDSYR